MNMSKKYLLLLFVLVALIAFSGVYVVGGAEAYARYQQNSIADKEHCGGQAPVRICVHTPPAIFSAFYPSYVAAQSPLFSVDYSSSSARTLLITVTIARFTQSQSQTVNALATVQSSVFTPPLQGQALHNLTTEMNTSLHVQATDTAGHVYYVNDIPILLHSRWLMQWTTANRLKIAAWTTPNDPEIVSLVNKAAVRLKNEQPSAPDGMIGYRGTRQQVIDQVDAIYDTLRLDYHIHYVQATVPYSGADSNSSAATQNVKLPAEVLQQHSGMCIELTALLASAVEKIGLNAEIVIIPGHAFLGVADSEGGKHFQYWDAVDVNNNVVADSANVAANNLYETNVKQHTILDTILIGDARAARVGPML
jgi:hypothetical protein